MTNRHILHAVEFMANEDKLPISTYGIPCCMILCLESGLSRLDSTVMIIWHKDVWCVPHFAQWCHRHGNFFCIATPLWRTLVTGGFPSQRASNAELCCFVSFSLIILICFRWVPYLDAQLLYRVKFSKFQSATISIEILSVILIDVIWWLKGN